MPRTHPGWRTPLGRFVSEYTVPRLCADLAARGEPVTRTAIYAWVHRRHVPRYYHARAVVDASGGALTLADLMAWSLR